jgi:hypothetical protein
MLVAGAWRPVPVPTWLTEPFWQAAREGRLLVQRCAACGTYVFRPQYACTTCLSTELEWEQSAGTGTLHSFSVVRRPAYPELPVPYVVVNVEMDEGWFMMSNLIGCTVDEVAIGLRVAVSFQECNGLSLPFVRPA